MIFPVAPPVFEFRVESGKGLSVVAGGVPIVQGSYFQIVSPDWKRSYFGSLGGPLKIENVDGDTVRASFKNAEVEGAQTYHRDGDRLKVHTEILYRGEGPAIAEVASGLVWVPATERDKTAAPPATETIGGRRLGPDAAHLSLVGPLGAIEVNSNLPLTAFDARRYPQGCAEGSSSIWLGNLSLPLERGKTTVFDVDWRVPTVKAVAKAALRPTLSGTPVPDARHPDESRPMLVPQPQIERLDFNSPIDVTGGWNLPIGTFDHYEEFLAAVARRFVVPPPGSKRINLDGGVSKLGFHPGGYRITIRADRGVTIVGEEDTGLRNAVERLAELVFLKNGKLYLPTGYLYDDPKVGWRGVHLFGGPNARSFQKTLWTRVLRPLGFDHVVLECERTAWDATPGIATAGTMTKAQLGDLFALYRNLGVEAVPLIQSFGHMEWLFANGKNLDLAMNPDVPYAVDPRKPRTKEVLSGIWSEAVGLAKPKAIHFGLDEISMRGWTGGDAFLTDTWKLQLGFLGGLAKKFEVDPMLWGDQALFAKEAPDAALAGTAADAAARRAAIPKGAFVTDWHYRDDPRPEAFVPTIQLWKDAGMRPIEAGWYRPDNVRGLALAAGGLGAGYLQTTWAGYESDEAGMLAHPEQFSAMVLAADYAWSGRKDSVNALPYDAQEVFRKLYYGRPSALAPQAGTLLGEGKPFTLANVDFRPLDLRLASVLKPDESAGSEIEWANGGKGRELNLALATEVASPVGSVVAEIRIERTGLPPLVERLVYGRDVRALADPDALSKGERSPGGPSLFRIDLGRAGTPITRITIRPSDTYSGLRVMGATLVG